MRHIVVTKADLISVTFIDVPLEGVPNLRGTGWLTEASAQIRINNDEFLVHVKDQFATNVDTGEQVTIWSESDCIMPIYVCPLHLHK